MAIQSALAAVFTAKKLLSRRSLVPENLPKKAPLKNRSVQKRLFLYYFSGEKNKSTCTCTVPLIKSSKVCGPSPGLWGVFIIAVHRAFVLGLGARHRGIVKLSEGG